MGINNSWKELKLYFYLGLQLYDLRYLNYIRFFKFLTLIRDF